MSWNSFRQFHEQPQVIAMWEKAFGPVLRWLTPTRRRFLLGTAALLVVWRFAREKLRKAERALEITPDFLHIVALALLLIGFAAVCYIAARKFAALPAFVRRRPQICLHAILWSLLAWIWFSPPSNSTIRTLLFGIALALPFLLWRVGYMLFAAQHRRMANTRLTDHLAYIFPVWGGSNTPYGKGWEYLAGNEAQNETELAKSQLAGIKLLLLSGLWSVVKTGFDRLFLDENNVFRGAAAQSLDYSDLFAQAGGDPLWLGWLALYLNLFSNVLGLASHGHRIIGWLRLLGFNVFRNTYKPLLAETVVEFWNRYYYYFKELLVNFFFYPIFARRFKAHPRLRIFAAVFAAAFIGNIYYHWLALGNILVAANFRAMWGALESRFFYCFLLAIGIWVSMMRHQRAGTAPKRGTFGRAVAIFGVWTFFSVIHIWAVRDPAPFLVRLNFFLRLIGVS